MTIITILMIKMNIVVMTIAIKNEDDCHDQNEDEDDWCDSPAAKPIAVTVAVIGFSPQSTKGKKDMIGFKTLEPGKR